MSREYEGQDPLTLAHQAEKDMHSKANEKGHDATISSNHGNGASDSSGSLDFYTPGEVIG
jgi:hypothetical protein